MLQRIAELIKTGVDFALETTLSTRSYAKLIKESNKHDYHVTLVYFWLSSENLAVRRVEVRVREGGHNIPENVIRRRYKKGLANFFNLFQPLVHNWMFIDNSNGDYKIMAQGSGQKEEVITSDECFKIKKDYDKGGY